MMVSVCASGARFISPGTISFVKKPRVVKTSEIALMHRDGSSRTLRGCHITRPISFKKSEAPHEQLRAPSADRDRSDRNVRGAEGRSVSGNRLSGLTPTCSYCRDGRAV